MEKNFSPFPFRSIPPLDFEILEETAIQRHPQESLRTAGIDDDGMDGMWMPSHESNPPTNYHYN